MLLRILVEHLRGMMLRGANHRFLEFHRTEDEIRSEPWEAPVKIESTDIRQSLGRIESLLAALLTRETAKEWYSTDEFAQLVGKAEFTIRDLCRLERLRAEKKRSSWGSYPAWAISHDELLRYRRDGLLPTGPVRA